VQEYITKVVAGFYILYDVYLAWSVREHYAEEHILA
jgi:hypothetical protein